jgi:hypothetical protein
MKCYANGDQIAFLLHPRYKRGRYIKTIFSKIPATNNLNL